MIYHLVNDEKIINRTIEIFETAFPGENLFIVFSKREFVHVKEGERVVSYKDFAPRRSDSSATSVIIHLMTNRKIKFIKRYIGEEVPVYWVMWGSDLYDRLLMPEGYELTDKQSSYYGQMRLRRFFRNIIKIPNDKVRILRRMRFIENRVKYLVTSTIEDDYDLIVSYYGRLKNKIRKEFSYYPVDMVIGDMAHGVTGNSIQIGHCGTLTNNHEYVFRLLAGLDIKDRQIIVPLSYSGTAKYKQALIDRGHDLWGDRFRPVTEFMPLEDYNNLMAGCSVAMYGNWRQEAVGNVLVSLYLGAKVFLSNKNPMLKWALRHGFKVFELEKISQAELDAPLAQADKEHNRTLLLQNYTSEALYKTMPSVFEER